jgi:rod shape determining protein RodA
MNKSITNIDWIIVGILLFITIFGCINIYSVDSGAEVFSKTSIFATNFSKQSIWLFIAIMLCCAINVIETKFFIFVAYPLYITTTVLLIMTILFGKSIGGHNAWLQLAGIRIQPAEFSKFTTALLIGHIMSNTNTSVLTLSKKFLLLVAIFIPATLILLQGDVGSSLVFFSFFLALFREDCFVVPIVTCIYIGIFAILALVVPQNYLSVAILCVSILAISLVMGNLKKTITVIFISICTLLITYGTHTVVNKILKPHQKNRITAWISPDSDPLGIGWNVNQSKIAIGSGGLWGKGLLKGTQTKYGFVPEQHTDFIFCTIGEEHGWVGCSIIIVLFIVLILRIIKIAERQRLHFARVYGYGLAAILLFHFAINVGMTIGLMPVIGIPLPFLSYGGSSLITFFVMTFILLKFDADRKDYISISKI